MNDLDELKTLLFGAEKETLDAIAERVEKREVRAADVADILPEAIHTSHQKDEELVESLKAPVSDVLQTSFREKPEFYGDALYPVMGPAIRKSIMHTLRAFVQEINTAVEHSLSAKGIKWRLQAWRAGVPFGDFVLQKTLLYRVEQAYLISRENGLLMGHVHHEASKIKDSDAVSAMFTAIQDFVKESFSPDRTGRLETADMGEFTLWAVHGPHALLVCVIRGLPPKNLRARLSAILERVHFRYGEAIRSYSGDTSTVPGVEEELQACLKFQAQQEAEGSKKRLSKPMILVLLALVALLGWLGYERWQNVQDFNRFESAIRNVPGIYVGDIVRDGERIQINGMRDPLAADVNSIATEASIEPARVQATMMPFQSLDPDIVLARAETMLATPAGVSLSLSGAELTATGSADFAWRDRAATIAAGLPGVDQITFVSPARDAARAAFAELGMNRFFFSDGTELVGGDAERMATYASRVSQLTGELDTLGHALSIELTGYTDGSGTDQFNTGLANERIELLRQTLLDAGVSAEAIATARQIAGGNDVNTNLRRVDVLLIAEPAIDP